MLLSLLLFCVYHFFIWCVVIFDYSGINTVTESFCCESFFSGTHWIYEIVNLIMNGGDASKIDRSKMVKLFELSLDINADIKDVHDVDAIPNWPVGYKEMENWESPRIISSHLHERFFPPDAWKKKVKVKKSCNGL